MLVKLRFEALEQREGVRSAAGEAGEDAILVQAAHLFRAALDDDVAERDLTVAAEGYGAIAPYRENSGAVELFHERAEARMRPLLYARHSSIPAMKMSLGSFLPMNTITEPFFSFLAQGLPVSPPIIMCTPWNTTRRGLPFIHSTPL